MIDGMIFMHPAEDVASYRGHQTTVGQRSIDYEQLRIRDVDGDRVK